MLVHGDELLYNSLSSIPTGDGYEVFFVLEDEEPIRQISEFRRGVVQLGLAGVNQIQAPQIPRLTRLHLRCRIRKTRIKYQPKEEASEGSRE